MPVLTRSKIQQQIEVACLAIEYRLIPLLSRCEDRRSGLAVQNRACIEMLEYLLDSPDVDLLVQWSAPVKESIRAKCRELMDHEHATTALCARATEVLERYA